MKVEYLNEFVVIAKLKSFSLAAEQLYISQSSLSKHIESLETELGYTLFDRTRRRVELSAQGKNILHYAVEIGRYADLIRAERGENLGEKQKELSIACIPVTAQFDFFRTVAAFEAENPDVHVVFHEYEGGDINAVLQAGLCSMAFQRIFYDYERRILEYTPFAYDSISVVLPEGHPMASKETVSMEELANERFLMMDSSTNLYELFVRECEKAGFIPNVIYTGHRPDTIMACVKNGQGVALFMRQPALYFQIQGTRVLDIEPKIISPIYLTRRRGGRHSEANRRFWEYVRAHSQITAGDGES